jgi:hypothetical protein
MEKLIIFNFPVESFLVFPGFSFPEIEKKGRHVRDLKGRMKNHPIQHRILKHLSNSRLLNLPARKTEQ